MVLFSYKAKNETGSLISDIIDAENLKAAAIKLRNLGYFPTHIQPHNQKGILNSEVFSFTRRKIGHKDVVLLTRRLADALKGGLSLARALKVIETQSENPELARIIKEIEASVREGKSFSEALANYPKIFTSMYTAMIKAGETAGILDVVLARLADFNEKEEDLRYRITSSLAYPAVMLFVGLLSCAFLLSFVIPKFEIMFQDLGQALPLPTRILILVSHSLRFGWWIYIPLIIIASVLLKKWYMTDKGKLYISDIITKLPVFGVFIRKELISRFIRILSILLSNGIPILGALTIARNSIDNRLFTMEIDNIASQVKEGNGLSRPLSQSKLFPPMVSEMISVGEETGNLESSLTRIADIYEREVEYAVKTMTSLLEPVIILFAGIVVCFIALSMLLPVFEVSSGLH